MFHLKSTKCLHPHPLDLDFVISFSLLGKLYIIRYLGSFCTIFFTSLRQYLYPSCLHTTWASCMSQLSSHTAPHSFMYFTCTWPSCSAVPPTRRISSGAGVAETICIKKLTGQIITCYSQQWLKQLQKISLEILLIKRAQ